MSTETPQKPGPDPARIKIDMDWKKAIGKALDKKRPADGWPEPEKKGEKPKKPAG